MQEDLNDITNCQKISICITFLLEKLKKMLAVSSPFTQLMLSTSLRIKRYNYKMTIITIRSMDLDKKLRNLI